MGRRGRRQQIETNEVHAGRRRGAAQSLTAGAARAAQPPACWRPGASSAPPTTPAPGLRARARGGGGGGGASRVRAGAPARCPSAPQGAGGRWPLHQPGLTGVIGVVLERHLQRHRQAVEPLAHLRPRQAGVRQAGRGRQAGRLAGGEPPPTRPPTPATHPLGRQLEVGAPRARHRITVLRPRGGGGGARRGASVSARERAISQAAAAAAGQPRPL